MESWEGRTPDTMRRVLELPALEVHASLPSTSGRIRELWQAGAEPWTGVLADRQTAGRGRYGRRWASPPGTGVWFSILLPAGGLPVDALLPLRIGIALVRGLEAGLPAIEARALGLKWPNDVLDRQGAKVAGILVERLSGGPREAVIAGIGVNVISPPDAGEVGTRARAAALTPPGAPPLSRWPVLAAACHAARTARALRDATLSDVELEQWHGRDALLGTEVRLRTGQGTAVAGTVRGIDAGGSLLLDTGGGLRALASGTVERGSSASPSGENGPALNPASPPSRE